LSQRVLLAWVWGLVVCLLLADNAHRWLGGRIAPDTDLLALLPIQERDPVLQQAFIRMVDSAQQRLIVLLGADDWVQASHAADAYSRVLERHPGLLQSSNPMTDRRDWLAPFQSHRLNLLTPQAVADLRGQPAQYWTDIALAKLYSPFVGLQMGAWRDDPFGLFGRWVQARAQETPVRPRDGRLFVSDNRFQYVVMPFVLRLPAFSMKAQQAVIPLLEQARQAAKKTVPLVEVLVAGVILHAAAAGDQARQEMSIIGIGSSIGIVLLIWVTFRRVSPVAMIVLSVVVGCLAALSVCSWLFGQLHILTLVFGASLVGVAQDYGIYFLCHRLGVDAQLDSGQLLRRLLPGLVLTLVTTVIGYFGLALTPFPGLRQMAVFSTVGLIFAWLTVVCWFPILAYPATYTAAPIVRWYGKSLARWPVVDVNRSTLLVSVLFIGLATFGLWRLGVNDDIRLLHNPPKSLIEDQIKLSRLLDTPSPVQFYIVRGTTPEVVLQREEMLRQRLDRLIEKNLINGYQAISNWVPSLRAQTTHRQLVERALLNEDGPLAALALRIGENGGWVAATRQHLLTSALTLTPNDFLKTPASEPWRHLWLGQVAGGYASIVSLRGLKKTGLPELQSAAAGLEGVRWVDQVHEISSVLSRYRKYMSWVVLLSYIAVYCLLYPRYRSSAWRVLAPTALASISTLALLGIADHSLQLFHMLALLLVLGIGVDYGIFFQESSTHAHHAAWLAVGLSALSTLLSFGLLGLSKTPALQAFGLTMSIGIATVWLIVPCFRNDPAQ
jgi:predicted exporter